MARVPYSGAMWGHVCIGPAQNQYRYEFVNGEFLKGTRGSDNAAGNEVLFMYKESDKYWYAVDAPRNCRTLADVKLEAVPVFRSCESALEEGWHTWETNWSLSRMMWPEWRATGLCCQTTYVV